jgi:hypothetical protein
LNKAGWIIGALGVQPTPVFRSLSFVPLAPEFDRIYLAVPVAAYAHIYNIIYCMNMVPVFIRTVVRGILINRYYLNSLYGKLVKLGKEPILDLRLKSLGSEVKRSLRVT